MSVVSNVGHPHVDVENVQPVCAVRTIPISYCERGVAENDRTGRPKQGSDDDERYQRARGAREPSVPVPKCVLVVPSVRRKFRARNIVANFPCAVGAKEERRNFVAGEQEVRHAAEVEAER